VDRLGDGIGVEMAVVSNFSRMTLPEINRAIRSDAEGIK
jgi:hypothetical protein